MKTKDWQIELVAAGLKFAGIIAFLCFAVYGGVQVEELTDTHPQLGDDEFLAYSLRFLGEALLYGGVLFGLGWAISLFHDRTRD